MRLGREEGRMDREAIERYAWCYECCPPLAIPILVMLAEAAAKEAPDA